MNIYHKLLKDHFDVQRGMYFSEYIELNDYAYFFSDIIHDGFWNYMYRLDGKNIIDPSAECVFGEKGIPVSYYFVDANKGATPKEYLLKFEEAFMLYNNGPVQLPNDILITRAISGKTMRDFIELFTIVYGGEKSSSHPYGNLDSSYVRALIRSFENTDQFHHFVCYADDRAVSVATLCMKNNKGGIYNVATNPKDRRHGYGTAVTLACINDWQNSGGDELFLQTQTGTIIERWYKRLGFKTVFIGKVFSKDEN